MVPAVDEKILVLLDAERVIHPEKLRWLVRVPPVGDFAGVLELQHQGAPLVDGGHRQHRSDRVPAFIIHAWAACQRVGSHFLFRIPRHLTAKGIKRWSDGSRRIRVAVREPGRPSHIQSWLDLREIRVHVGRQGFRQQELRLWTSLLSPRTAPALELAQRYAARWEHERYFREAKRVLRQTDVLQSHTVITAAQEIAAIVLATALLARERARVATGQVPALRVKFGVVLAIVRSQWFFLGPCEDLLTDRQKDQIVQRGHALMRGCVTAKKRSRSCPRAVRQPIRQWPRLLKTASVDGPVQFTGL